MANDALKAPPETQAAGLSEFLESVSRSLELSLEMQVDVFRRAVVLHPELAPSSRARHTVDDATRTFLGSVQRFRAELKDATRLHEATDLQNVAALMEAKPPTLLGDQEQAAASDKNQVDPAPASREATEEERNYADPVRAAASEKDQAESLLDRKLSCESEKSKGSDSGQRRKERQIGLNAVSSKSPAMWASPESSRTLHSIREDMTNSSILWRMHEYTKWLVIRKEFEMTFALLIVINATVMAFQCQYEGSVLDMHGDGEGALADDRVASWPLGFTDTMSVFEGIEWCFGILFIIEIAMKLIGLGLTFFVDWWNYLDIIVVASWFVTTPLKLDFNATIFRLCRLGRLFRLVKLMRTFKGMDALVLMFTALEGSVASLGWAIAMLTTVQVLCALVMNQLLFPYFQDPHRPLEERVEVYLYFGTFTRSMLSMFELTLANWPPVCRCVQENVSQWYTSLFLLHKLVVGFAVVGIINGVFMQETLKVTALDDRIMVRQKERQKTTHAKKMKMFFAAADEDASGKLTLEEFKRFVCRPEVAIWLAAQDLDVSDQEALWELIDDGDGVLTVDELIAGVSKLKGTARSIDLVLLMREVEQLRRFLPDSPKPSSGFSQRFKTITEGNSLAQYDSRLPLTTRL